LWVAALAATFSRKKQGLQPLRLQGLKAPLMLNYMSDLRVRPTILILGQGFLRATGWRALCISRLLR
jgi:hypothetical protein